MGEKLANVHPREVLLEEFVTPMDLSQNRLARYFGTSEAFWTGLQADYDPEETRQVIADQLARIEGHAA
ncbi:MAG: helix-turn-helix transcriptional regulator [Deferrisomatales bacterium]